METLVPKQSHLTKNQKKFLQTKHQKRLDNSDSIHHPDEKIAQIKNVFETLPRQSRLRILELFAGRGNLTQVYKNYGNVKAYDKNWLQTGDSFLEFHRLIADQKKYDIIDIDPYGFPTRFFPDIFLLMNKGVMFITIPKPNGNFISTECRFTLSCYYGDTNPNLTTIVTNIKALALQHWRDINVLDVIDCKSIWRIAISVQRINSKEYVKKYPHIKLAV